MKTSCNQIVESWVWWSFSALRWTDHLSVSVCRPELQRADWRQSARVASSEASGAGSHRKSPSQPGPQEPGAPQVGTWNKLVVIISWKEYLSRWLMETTCVFPPPLCSNIRCFRVDPSPSAPCVSESHGAPAVWSHGYTEATGVKNKSVLPPHLSVYFMALFLSLHYIQWKYNK